MSLLHAALAREQDWRTIDPDEFDAPPQCEVCRVEIPRAKVVVVPKPRPLRPVTTGRKSKAKVPVGGTYTITRPLGAVPLCDGCRALGWKGARCECGAVLHRRDYPQNHRRWRACGKCREAIRREREIT